MQLILARHGNTFVKGEKIYWVGARNDLPLTVEGCAQAARLGGVLAKGIDVTAVYYAPLKRTKQFAKIAVEPLHHQPQSFMDNRLTELDYGKWSGLSDDEIKTTFGAECFNSWNDHCVWPSNCGWLSSSEIVEQEIKDWVQEIRERYSTNSTILAVTSNGRLRYFLKLVNGEFDSRVKEKTFKVGTGKVCLLQIDPDTASLKLWNADPESLLPALLNSKK